ncbi:MAG: methylated-DNA--[protein]-cysteine S-methyltransferase [Halothiobacillaceae bacterium]
MEKALFDPEALDAAEWAALAASLQPEGTAFARNVWDAIDRVPAGQWASYADLAEYLNAPRAVRAVATACGRNPVAVLRPCHRILRSDGHPGRYRWGTAIKRALLRREAILTPDGEAARPNARWQP